MTDMIQPMEQELNTSVPSDESVVAKLAGNPPPEALADGWIMHRSKSHLGNVYYFNQFTGDCRWEAPHLPRLNQFVAETLDGLNKLTAAGNTTNGTLEKKSILKKLQTGVAAPAPAPVIKTLTDKKGSKRSTDASKSTTSPSAPKSSLKTHSSKNASPSNSKKRSRDGGEKEAVVKKSKREVSQVRCLHILRKHAGSKRPKSWRNPKITVSKEDAIEELQGIMEVLQEEAGDPEGLRATFEELAKTESDCSSAKRNGDLGFFGRKKMQPAFEKASFALKVGELSKMVETSSGVHVILRIG